MGTWIEINNGFSLLRRTAVVPLVGTWIEICCLCSSRLCSWSFPLWERGLKLKISQMERTDFIVVPLVGTWIEIYFVGNLNTSSLVVPLVGTWIEIKGYNPVPLF